MTAATTAPALLAARLRSDGAGPLLTCYDDATGERVELSTTTFANWVAKTANLLVDGLGCGPGDTAAVCLPMHWQSVAVAAGCWAAGLVVDLGGQAGDAAVLFTAEGGPTPAAPGGDEVRLSLRPLGGRLATPDPGVTDYAAEVLAYGDRYGGPTPAAADPALPGTSHAALVGGTDPRADRILLAPDGDPPLDRPLLVAAYLAPLAGGGSTVLCRHPDPAALPRRLEAERATPVAAS
ncbi:MAG TPA: TIGR03089 family protein [Mycobacteriales bacterium]|nr:TIGR03089 family protein [Mycobacteriales bacterium]